MIEVQDYARAFKLIDKMFPKLKKWLRWELPDKRRQASSVYLLSDTFLLVILMRLLRYRSLRAFVLEMRDNKAALENLKKYFNITAIPSDDEIRYILQAIPTSAINKVLQKIQNRLERRKALKSNLFMDKYYLLSLDGSGHIGSHKISCDRCLTRHIHNGEVYHMHHQLVAALINDSSNYALTALYEPIENDGVREEYEKNDCESRATKRALAKLKALYPKRVFCITADNLHASKPFVEQLLSYGYHFILTAKPEKNEELFSWFEYLHERRQSYSITDSYGHRYEYYWTNKLPIKQEYNEKNFLWVNLLEYTEYDNEGQKLYHSSWMTDFLITKSNVKEIAKGGRARFAIENKVFNEQKTRGFETEHNFGHFGNLPSVFFGAAQISHLLAQLFALWTEGKQLIKNIGSHRRFWERLATLFTSIALPAPLMPVMYIKLTINTS